MSTVPEWLVPGAAAVILQPHNQRAALKAEPVTIDRVLKRDVVLSNGERFRVDALSKTVGGTWGTLLYLVPADDPRVAETRHSIRVSNAKTRAEVAYHNWRTGKATPEDVVAAFRSLQTAETRR